MLIDVCFVMCVMHEPQGEQCCALMGYAWVNMTYYKNKNKYSVQGRKRIYENAIAKPKIFSI